jgi:iron(III) transport system substrate-binding protein
MTSERIIGLTGSGEMARLKAYSSFEPYELADYSAALAKAVPGIALEIERMSTAALTQRLLDEVDAPQADLVLGWADTAAQTAGLEGICPAEGGKDGYIRPTGFSTAFITDPALLAACGGTPVRTWADLAQQPLQGRISFPDPSVSGAGFLAMSTILQRYGTVEGWSLLQAICANVRDFPGSAWAPALQTGGGTIAVGVTVLIAAGKRQSEMPALQVIEPADVTGAEAEVYGVLKTARAPDAAQLILDWLLSAEAEARFRAWRKTMLSGAPDRLFMIDSAKAITERSENLVRFRAVMQFTREVV